MLKMKHDAMETKSPNLSKHRHIYRVSDIINKTLLISMYKRIKLNKEILYYFTF